MKKNLRNILLSAMTWLSKRFIKRPWLIIPFSMLMCGLGWGLVTSIIISGETAADAWVLLAMAPIGLFMFKSNSVFLYGFTTGTVFGFFFGLIYMGIFIRNLDKISAQLENPINTSTSSKGVSRLSKNIAKIHMVIVASVYLYTILTIYNNHTEIKYIFDIPWAYLLLCFIAILNLLASTVLLILTKILKPESKVYENIGTGLYLSFLISGVAMLGMHLIEIVALSQNSP